MKRKKSKDIELVFNISIYANPCSLCCTAVSFPFLESTEKDDKNYYSSYILEGGGCVTGRGGVGGGGVTGG